MDPMMFTDDDIATMPFPHERVTFAETQPQYRPLPTIRLLGNAGVTISRWSLTDAERAAIAAGADVYLQMVTFGRAPMPILPTIGLRADQICDAGYHVNKKTVTINGTPREVVAMSHVSYEEILMAAGLNPARVVSVVYKYSNDATGGTGVTHGTVRPGQSVALVDGMVIEAYDTSNA